MTIRSQIRLLAAIAIALVLVMGVRLWASTIEVDEHYRDGQQIKALDTVVTQMRGLLAENVLYHEARPQNLWASKMAELRRSLRERPFSMLEQQALADRIFESTANVATLFDRLQALSGQRPVGATRVVVNDDVTAGTISALFVAMQEMDDQVAAMARINDDAVLAISNRRQWVSLSVLVLFASLIGSFFYIIWRSVLRPLDHFQRATERVGAGDLDFRIDAMRSDELGQLARAFDRMTAQLKGSSLALHDEIEERSAAQRQLAETAGQLGRDLAARHAVEANLLQVQEQLRRQKARLLNVMHSGFIGIVIGDFTGRFLEVNEKFAALSGYGNEQLLDGKVGWRELVVDADQERLLDALRGLDNGASPQLETRLRRADGSETPVMIGLARLPGDEEWAAFLLDLTEKHHNDRIKAEFISIVSHELRTPLTSIRGALGLLEGGVAGNVPAQAAKLIHVANENSKRLGTLVNDILDLDKLAAGKMRFDIGTHDLVTLVQQALDANRAYAAACQVRLHMSAHPRTAWARADEARLMQVLANLLSNAAKFSPAGADVEVRIAIDGLAYRIEVEDQGPGIPQEFRAQMFSAFAQASSTLTRQHGGSGLGLRIARAMAEGMGGKLGYASEEGRGSTFWVTLPLARVSHRPAELSLP